MLITLIIVIISLYMSVSDHHSVYLKYIYIYNLKILKNEKQLYYDVS